ncbi:unnamed protein product [Ilex paraguariensis]|uniref:Uncharacterized protein n=1 Tax=Ilex paraguariensis TaxID=185542 RepID=A0ABC8SDM1_9AQUA
MSTSRRGGPSLSCTAQIQNILDEDLKTNVSYFPSEILVPELEANETKLKVCAIDDYYGIVGINQKDFPTKLQSRVEKPPFLFHLIPPEREETSMQVRGRRSAQLKRDRPTRRLSTVSAERITYSRRRRD